MIDNPFTTGFGRLPINELIPSAFIYRGELVYLKVLPEGQRDPDSFEIYYDKNGNRIPVSEVLAHAKIAPELTEGSRRSG